MHAQQNGNAIKYELINDMNKLNRDPDKQFKMQQSQITQNSRVIHHIHYNHVYLEICKGAEQKQARIQTFIINFLNES